MYGKIFACTFNRSMRGAGSHVFAVMGYVIANTVNSRVELNPEVLAFLIGESEDKIQAAIDYLCSPDPRSTHDEFDGRRLVKEGQFQYFVPTHEIYRNIGNAEDLKEANRMRVAAFRARKGKRSERNGELPDLTAIYEAYPKKVGRPKALASIEKAVEQFGYDFVLERTRLYAAARTGEDHQFTPMPATWFNQQRFNDDPSTWKNTTSKPSNPTSDPCDRAIGTANAAESVRNQYDNIGKVGLDPRLNPRPPQTL